MALRIEKFLRRLIPPAVWLGVWQLASLAVAAGLDRPQGADLLLPGPLLVGRTLLSLAQTLPFWQSAGLTLLRILGGFAGGVAAGTLLALLTAFCPWADWIISPAVRLIRAVPVASFILLVLLWAPTGQVPVIISGLMVLPVIWGNVGQGVAETDPLLLEAARAYGFGRWKRFRLVYAPAAAPYFFSGCHTALGLAWKAGVAAEVLCTPRLAVGAQIYYARMYLETPKLFAWTAVVAALSFLLEGLLGRVVRRLGGKRHG